MFIECEFFPEIFTAFDLLDLHVGEMSSKMFA